MKRFLSLFLAALMLFGLASCGEGKGAYEDLEIVPGVEIGVEEYAIAFREGSDMVAKVDAITADLFNDGTIKSIAEKYEVENQLVPSFAAASGQTASSESDWAKIQSKGKLVIGITDYAPMDYKDADGNWIGFDAEYARKVCEKLGVTAEFKVIDWNTKTVSLSTGAIDCIWNGMTVTNEITEACDVTGAYMKNYQVVVVKNAKKYPDLASLAGKKIAVEAGSAGETAAKADSNLASGVVPVQDQSTALLQVKSGAADACVIDFIMAKTLVGE
ncbi:MAG: transporter substrate-binding domain-containing protein [Clostridia bacterium]|nr:transporter substrate-binding domain-containing protein [Clostridia bacterium]